MPVSKTEAGDDVAEAEASVAVDLGADIATGPAPKAKKPRKKVHYIQPVRHSTLMHMHVVMCYAQLRSRAARPGVTLHPIMTAEASATL